MPWVPDLLENLFSRGVNLSPLLFFKKWVFETMYYLRRDDLRRLNSFDRIFILSTGGMDSTFMALQFLDHERWIRKPVYLFWNNTGIELAEAKRNLFRLMRIYDGTEKFARIREQDTEFHSEIVSRARAGQNGIPSSNSKTRSRPVVNFQVQDPTFGSLLVLKPDLPEGKKPIDIVSESFAKIPIAQERLKEGKFQKGIFPCCYHLKEKPMQHWMRDRDGSKECFVLSIGPSDSKNRRYWLISLRRRGTMFHFNKTFKSWYFYPLRDTTRAVIKKYISTSLLPETGHSSCRVCPVLVALNLKRRDPKRYYASKKKWLQLQGKLCT